MLSRIESWAKLARYLAMARATKALKAQKGRFVGIPYAVANSQPFLDLRAPEVKLLFDLMVQYNGSNNGSLSCCHTLMRVRGWAKSSLYRAFTNLQHSGFIVVTRQGMKTRGMATLVAVTWNPIHEPREGVEYDGGIVTSNTPLNFWCQAKSSWKHKPRAKQPRKSTPSKMENKLPSYPSKLELVRGGKA